MPRRAFIYLAILTAAAIGSTGSASAAGPPTIPAAWVTGVNTASAVLRAEVNPQGLSTAYHFEYLTHAAYEANLDAGHEPFEGARAVPSSIGAVIGAGTVPVKVAFTLIAPANRLAPGTSYRFRAVAANGGGTTASAPHGFRTEDAVPPPGLPDGRAWEMVSPVDKGGGAIAPPGELFGGGEIQAAGAGGALTYGSATAFGQPAGAPPVSQYLSVRGSGGWSTANLSAPLEAGGYGDDPDGAPYRLFSTDLARGLMLNGSRCAAEGSCPPSYSLWSAGSLQAIPALPGLSFQGAGADLGHIFFGADEGLYEWSGGALEQIGIGAAALAAPLGAVSSDASRVYFTAPPEGAIYLHEDGIGARLVPESPGTGTAFQAASADGSLAYFTRAGALYRYAAASDASAPIAADVTGVLAVSPDGGYVYYQDQSGLQAWHDGAVTEIAAGADAALPSDYPPATATARVSAAGTVLAFLSAAPITGYDNTDAETGQPDAEVYVYDAVAGSLVCASCNPTGERPADSASIPGALVNGTTTAYRPRALSADGRRLFFEAGDARVRADTNSGADVYQWEAVGKGSCAAAPGCLALVSGGRDHGSRFLDASADGSDVFFITADSLVGADPGSIDAYDARIGGGFPDPQEPIPCVGDACQALPSPPDDPPTGTSVTSAPNPRARYFKERSRRAHKHRKKHGKHRHRAHGKHGRGRAAR